MSGVRAVSGSRVEIPAACEIHLGSGRLMVRREGARVVLDGRADHCCVLTLERAAATVLVDAVAESLE